MRRADHVRHVQQRMRGVAQRLLLIDIDRRHAGPAGAERLDQRAALDQLRAAGVDDQCGRLHAAEIVGGDDVAGFLDQPHVKRQHVAALEERKLARGHEMAFGLGANHRVRPRPDHDIHAESLAVARDRRTDPAVAENAERLVAQGRADPDLPVAGLERGHLLGDLPERREDQPPGQFRGGIGRRAGMLARRHDTPRAVQASMSIWG